LGALQELVLTPDYFCQFMVEICPNVNGYKAMDLKADMISIVQDKPADAVGYINKIYKEIAADPKPRKTIKVVQFSDAHLDLYYQEGSTVNCGRSYCCRAESEPDPLPEQRELAGKFGSYGWCDVPKHTLQSVLNQIKEHAQPDFIFWTGDSTAHDDPWVSQQEVNDALTTII
jgi:hypothetical protein